ncbi:MAG: hypothetical protein SNH35_06680 [Rikenellaceae bacterium]
MFVREPEPFASFRGELVFEYEQNEESDLVFEIELEGEEESQEVKKLYGVSSAVINVAHVVANKFMTTPSSGSSSLETPESGFGKVKLKCGDDESSSQYFVAAQVSMPEAGVLSSMPKSRTISYGEAEEIWIRAQVGSVVQVEVAAVNEGRESVTQFDHTAQECGLVRFRFVAEDFGAFTKMAKVTILVDGATVEELVYYYVLRDKGAVRLAWIGEYGGVEHYTFPVTNALTRYKSGVSRYDIESMYEPQSVVEALAEALESERVWIVESEVYSPVEMVSESVVLNAKGELATVSYKIERYD